MMCTEARLPHRPPDHSPEGQRAARKTLWDVSMVLGVVAALAAGTFFFIENVPPIDPVGKSILALLVGALTTSAAAAVLTRP